MIFDWWHSGKFIYPGPPKGVDYRIVWIKQYRQIPLIRACLKRVSVEMISEEKLIATLDAS
jgi:hypothetical protein